jgi:hypothetical protein
MMTKSATQKWNSREWKTVSDSEVRIGGINIVARSSRSTTTCGDRSFAKSIKKVDGPLIELDVGYFVIVFICQLYC